MRRPQGNRADGVGQFLLVEGVVAAQQDQRFGNTIPYIAGGASSSCSSTKCIQSPYPDAGIAA